MPEPAVIVAGNLSEGYRCYGPYLNWDAAADSPMGQGPDTWVMGLRADTGTIVPPELRCTWADCGEPASGLLLIDRRVRDSVCIIHGLDMPEGDGDVWWFE